jgi:hypothetical protein
MIIPAICAKRPIALSLISIAKPATRALASYIARPLNEKTDEFRSNRFSLRSMRCASRFMSSLFTANVWLEVSCHGEDGPYSAMVLPVVSRRSKGPVSKVPNS